MCCLLLTDDKLRPFVGNARAVTGGGGSFGKITRIEAEIEPWIFIVQQIKFPLLLTDRKKMLLIVNNAYTVLVVECKRKFLEQKIDIVVSAGTLTGEEFQEKSSNGNQNKPCKLFLPNNVPVNIVQS